MNKNTRALILFTVPFAVFLFIVLIAGRTYENNRQEDSEEEAESGVVLEESRLVNEDDYPKTSREDITELETELIAETELEDAEREVEEGDRVTVNYRGWRAEDKFVFDQSFNRGDQGFTFTVGSGVIQGWSEGVQGMKVGEIRRLYIPSELAYGANGSGENIPPNTDLIFDVEVLSFE